MKPLGLTEYGGDEFLIAVVACGATAFALSLIHPVLAVLPLIPFAIIVWFFRDPNRTGVSDPAVLLSPADGTVSDIIEVDEPNYIKGKALRIGIFLSPFNVHVNRAPCAGTVRWVDFKSGEFLPAYNPEAPTRNESASMGLERSDGIKLIVKQITGILARRIICPAKLGDTLDRGQRYGMIKFGSRTELYIPIANAGPVSVKVGDKVIGGHTPLATILPSSAPVEQLQAPQEALSA
jgi:phosphatidylserine decarboxylase